MSSTDTTRSEIRRSFSHATRTSYTSVDEQRVGATYHTLAEWRFPANSPFDLGSFQLTVEPPSPRSLSGEGRASLPSSKECSDSDCVSYILDPSLMPGQSFGLTYYSRSNIPVARISAQIDVQQLGLSRDSREFSLHSEPDLVESIAEELVAETRAQLVIPRASLGDEDSEEALAAALVESGRCASTDGHRAPKVLVVRDREVFAENVKQRVQSRRTEARQAVELQANPLPTQSGGPKKRIPLESMTQEQRAELDAKLTAFLLFYVVNSPSGPL